MRKTQRDEFQEKIGLGYNIGENNKTAFLTNFKTRTFIDMEEAEERMALLCYFQDQFGETFKCYYPFSPYFYVGFQNKAQHEVRAYIESQVPKILNIQVVEKVDLEELNHLSGRKKKYLKISFRTVADLTNGRKFFDLKKKKNYESDMYLSKKKNLLGENPKDLITDIREFDVPYHCRVCIDTGLRAGKWFELELSDKFIIGLKQSSKKSIPDMKILAYDIETSKDPFKFPQREKDIIMMISLMFEGQAILIVNRDFCHHHVNDFDYEPEGKPQFKCQVQVYNVESERQTILKFSQIIQTYKPTVITSFNGDRFDYPFIEARCIPNNVEFIKEMGVNDRSGQYFGSYVSHLDCYYWVDRDAFLPQGSRGLKAVTRSKLKYQPIEVDPEDMVEMGQNQTQKLAQYSVSDAVATFFLYMKHIHGFIFALSTIIPMMPDEVLRKGSGTLCENLLMAEAYSRGIIFPNKQIENFQKFYKGHLLDSETYTGGKVECLRSGIYRADFETDFTLDPRAFQDLINNIDEIIKFTVIHEKGETVDNIANYDEVKETVVESLLKLKNVPNPSKYETLPLIYHIDVAAMYPNIIITNRLQPVAVVNDRICSGCLFNSPQNNCKRPLQWQWKGQYFPLNEGQYSFLKEKQAMKDDPDIYNKGGLEKVIKNEVKKYCQKIYSKVHIPLSQIRRDTVCMRENSFYVDTVRAFRDRRYEFKALVKVHRARAAQYGKQGDPENEKEQIKLMELYESMQLAHKIILNSFYGYVMRRGSRWYSMETAAMVTYIGSNIINDSKIFVQGKIGKPLQLDTDGIWMLLPKGFPEDVKIKLKNGKEFMMSYPCQILNQLIYEKYANPQYQELISQEKFEYSIKKEMTIAFEIDGPYKAMFIPGGKDKKKTTELDIQQHSTQMLKKRYVVFNFKNQVSEFKGLQMKRRGQLNIIKMFQSQIFSQYVKGNSLKECYDYCAGIASKYFSFITNKGQGMNLNDILERLEQSKNLSKDVKQYGESKGVAITSAKRLAEYLGPQVVKGKNLCCYYIISAFPPKKTVTQRAIPTQIFYADEQLQKKYLYMWTKQQKIKESVDIRDILDWDYYKERLSTQIQKMVCIPAVMQNIQNPVADIELPDWLQKKTFDMRFHRQQKIFSYGFGNGRVLPAQTPTKARIQEQKMIESEKHKDLFENKKSQLFRNRTKNPYSMKGNFKSWLQEQKKNWKNHKREAVQNESFKYYEFKSILQIVPDNKPGYFTVWYFSGGRIQNLLLNFNRHYYVKDKKGNKKAPRQEGAALQIIVEEEIFLKNEDYYDSILGRTFYETKVPLIINLLLKKGNVWKINKQLPTYREQDIHQVFGGQYLPNIQNNFMPIIYISRVCVMDTKYIYTVINPRTKEYNFVYVDHSTGKSNDQLLRLARKTIKKDDSKLNIKFKATQMEACLYINELLQNHEKHLKQSFLLVLQADCSTSQLKALGLTCLANDFPVLSVLPVKLQKVTSLDWRQKVMVKIIQQSEGITKHVVNLLQWSRFTHIPICNLSQNQNNLLDFVTNITYGRLLHSGDLLTWWNQYNSEIVSTYESSANVGRIVNSGLYSSFCVQINLDNLAVNTIANSEELMFEDRQAAMIMQKQNTSKNTDKIQYLDEMTQAKKGFEYLKKMVKGWLKDLDVDWEKANDLLRNLHKWISTHSNAMFDPLLLRMINELMKKMFNSLIKKLSNLGMEIIFANFSKIIVATEKHTYKEAQNTIAYILKKCMGQNQKLFGYMTLNTLKDYYQVLLYEDPYNFVGVLVKEETEENTEENNFEYCFEIAKLFNPIVQGQFQTLILQFINNLCEIKKDLVREYATNKMRLMLNYEQLITQRMLAYIRQDFSGIIQQSIARASNLWEKEKEKAKEHQTQLQQYSQENSESDEGQELDDSFIEDSDEEEKKAKKNKKKKKEENEMLINLEKWGNNKQLDLLIENLFKILSYQELYCDELNIIRKQALRFINEEPNISYDIIKPHYPQFQLPCSVCFLVNEQTGECEHCKEPINAKQELQVSVWKMMQEQGRDLYCSRCNRIMEDYMKKCPCGGKWQIRQKPLNWLPYLSRKDKVWDYINKVFDFMGLQ